MHKVFAADPLIIPGGGSVPQPDGFKFNTIGEVVGLGTSGAIPFIFAFAGIGLLLMLISAGFNFLTSAGDPKKLEMGKQRLTYAIVGFLIIFTAYWAVQLAGVIFGIEEIKSVFK